MKRAATAKRERNLFLPALAGFFVAGIFLARHTAAGLWPLWILAVSILLIIPLRMLHLPLRMICLPVTLVLALLWTQAWLNPAMPEEGNYDLITATVYGDSKITSSGNVSFIAADVTINGQSRQGKAYATVYTVYEDDGIELSDGQHIQFSGKVYHPYPKENEYDFDFEMWMYQNGIRYGITSVDDIVILADDGTPANYAQQIAAVSYAKLQAVMGDKADLVVAMLLGDTGNLAEDDYQAFQQAGVAHIMAVSGLHVGILSMALLWLLERLRLRKKWKIPLVALFLLLYCGITGFAVSSLRAAVMVMLWIVSRAFGRKANPLTVVSAAVLIVLVINPLQLFSAGFALSFSAIAGITLLYPRLMQGLNHVWKPVRVKKEYRVRHFMHRLRERMKQALAVAISAQLGVLLPIAAYYHVFYPYSLSFNLLIIPLVSVLVPLFAVTTVVLWMPLAGGFAGAVLGSISGFGSDLLFWLVQRADTFPLSQIRMAQPDVWVCLAAFVSAVILSHFIRASLRRRLLALAVVAVIAITGSMLSHPAAVRYHQLSVGSADAALLMDGAITIGIDTGNTGYEMLNRLLAEGRDLDVLILTHLHADHAGGLQTILDEGIDIGQVYLPVDYQLHGYDDDILSVIERLEAEGIPVSTLQAGDTLSFPEISIDVLWPEAGKTREGIDPNDRSLAMLITMGDVRILSMADNGMLYENYIAVSADILKVGHHGSKTSTGDMFLDVVSPSLAVISVRSSTMPGEALLERLQTHDTRVLSTDDTGEITIIPEDNGYRAYLYITEETP